MFGYIKPYKPEMKIKEYDIFKAYYCGLCKELGKRYGQLSRFTLNYEFTFLAVFLSALSDENIIMKAETCIASPIKKKPVIKENPFIFYASDMSAILTYYKFVDIKNDGGHFSGNIGSFVFYRQFLKAKEKYPDKAKSIKGYLKELDRLEKAGCAKVDIAAEPFANILKEVFLYPGLKLSQENMRYIEDIAYHLGRFIYIIDAYDDIEKDIKSGGFNPILEQFNFNDETTEAFKEKAMEWIYFNLTFTLSKISETFDKLELKKNREIIDNILKLGLYYELERIMRGEKACKTHMKY